MIVLSRTTRSNLEKALAAGATALAMTLSVVPTAHADPATLNAFGGREGLGLLATDFVDRLAADKRIGAAFKDTNRPQLAKQLADQFCAELGGPCQYKGPDMKTAHADMDITKSQFNALVEVLQASMAARGVPFRAQNVLLAKLAPMHRDVITK